MKVLVVDDDRMMVRTISYILESDGFETLTAFSGEEAIEKVKAEMPDCVLMDIKMPGISGVDALKEIINIAPDLPVVLMSAFSTDELIDEAKAHGAYSVLTKPVDIETILLLLDALRKEGSILIVDDDPDFCKTMSYILRSKGYNVETEVDPARVLEHLEHNEKLAIILDLKLGTMSGLDVLKAIREKRPSDPVILITAYREEMTASIEKGLEVGAHACLYKPLDMEALFVCIGKIRRQKHKALMGDAA